LSQHIDPAPSAPRGVRSYCKGNGPHSKLPQGPNYQNFQTSGMVIRKESFEKYGKFKSSMKLTFVYEFLLRMTYNSVNIMTIPKIGYKHLNLREGSIFWNYKNGSDILTHDEVKFWIESAKKEHFFTTDRQIKYELQTI
jgi:hypothetical protein